MVLDSSKSGEEGQILTRKASCEDVCDACTCSGSGSGSDNQCSINNDSHHHTHHDKLCPDIIPGKFWSDNSLFCFATLFVPFSSSNCFSFIFCFACKGDEVDVEMCDESTMMMVIPNGHHHHHHHHPWLTGSDLASAAYFLNETSSNPVNLVMNGTSRINYHLLNNFEGMFFFAF